MIHFLPVDDLGEDIAESGIPEEEMTPDAPPADEDLVVLEVLESSDA